MYIGFDLQYLLFLQNLRESTGGLFDEFFNALSKLAVDLLPFLPFIIYWCVNKRLGYRFMATAWIGEVLNGVIKLNTDAIAVPTGPSHDWIHCISPTSQSK